MSISSYGVQPQGFVSKPLSVIQDEFEAALMDGPLGQSAGTNPDGSLRVASIAGQVTAIVVDVIAGCWDLLQAVYACFDPAQASAEAEDAVCSITGTIREPEAYSTVTETCTGVPGTQIPAGSGVSVPSTGSIFNSLVQATIGSTLASWSGTAFPVGTRITNAGGVYQSVSTAGGTAAVAPVISASAYNPATTYSKYAVVADPGGNLWYCSTSPSGAGGTIAWPTTDLDPGTTTVSGSNGTTFLLAELAGSGEFTDASATDGPIVWQYLGVGTGAVDVSFEAATVGPIGATAGTLTQIVNPVYGWQGAYNVEDAAVGALQESDTALRVRREAELHADSGSSIEAIRRQVLAVGEGTPNAVTSCLVFQNDTDFTSDGTTPANCPAGMPPHSVMVLSDYAGSADQPALDAAIAQAIWDAVGAGIPTTFANATGSSAYTSTVTDSQGFLQTVYWARPSPIEINVILNVTYDDTPGVFPLADADALIAGGTLQNGEDTPGAVPTYGASFPAAKNVWASGIASAVFDGPTDSNPGTQPVPGILDVQVLIAINPTTPTGSAMIPIDQIERAVFSSENITVNLNPASP